jgi:hypothetical protein
MKICIFILCLFLLLLITSLCSADEVKFSCDKNQQFEDPVIILFRNFVLFIEIIVVEYTALIGDLIFRNYEWILFGAFVCYLLGILSMISRRLIYHSHTTPEVKDTLEEDPEK